MKTHSSYITGFTILLSLLLCSPTFALKHTVNVGNYFFNPSSLNVSVGDTVRWVWLNGSHTTTSSSVPAGASTWDHMINSTNTFYEYPVTVAGTYNYVCTPHAGMGMVGSFVAAGAAPTLVLTPSNQNVSSTSGNTSFDVTSNSNWTATSNVSWCTVTNSGSGNGTISATYTSNLSTTPRVATITVTVTGLPAQTTTVSQSGAAPTLAVTPPSQSVNNTIGATTFTITSNTNWTAVSNSTWCTVNPSGSGNGIITATYTQNPGADPRTARITVTVSGIAPVTVTVLQDGTVGIMENTMADLKVYPNPSNGSFTVGTTMGELKDLDVTVHDISGRTIYFQHCTGDASYQFNLTGKPDGVYFLRMKSAVGIRVERILIRN